MAALSDADFRHRMGEAGRVLVSSEGYTWPQIAQQYIQLYEDIASQPIDQSVPSQARNFIHQIGSVSQELSRQFAREPVGLLEEPSARAYGVCHEAVIFYLEGQGSLVKDIERLLRQLIFDGIEVERHVISRNPAREQLAEHEAARSYLKMLRACMIWVKDFRIVVGIRPDSWCYLGDEQENEALFARRFLQISRDDLKKIFPAVAIMDRMVMVLAGFQGAFQVLRTCPGFLSRKISKGLRSSTSRNRTLSGRKWKRSECSWNRKSLTCVHGMRM